MTLLDLYSNSNFSNGMQYVLLSVILELKEKKQIMWQTAITPEVIKMLQYEIIDSAEKIVADDGEAKWRIKYSEVCPIDAVLKYLDKIAGDKKSSEET